MQHFSGHCFSTACTTTEAAHGTDWSPSCTATLATCTHSTPKQSSRKGSLNSLHPGLADLCSACCTFPAQSHPTPGHLTHHMPNPGPLNTTKALAPSPFAPPLHPHPRPPRSDASGHLEIDLGNLSAYDPTPLNPEDFTPLNRGAKCLELATAMTQALVSQLFALPSEAVQGGRLAHLPPPSTALPREKPIPKPKPLTKWQKFAQVGAVDGVGVRV